LKGAGWTRRSVGRISLTKRNPPLRCQGHLGGRDTYAPFGESASNGGGAEARLQWLKAYAAVTGSDPRLSAGSETPASARGFWPRPKRNGTGHKTPRRGCRKAARCGGRKPSIGCGVGARATRGTLAGTAGGAIGADIRADTPASSGPVRAASKAEGPMAAPAISEQQKSFLLLRPNRVWPGRSRLPLAGDCLLRLRPQGLSVPWRGSLAAPFAFMVVSQGACLVGGGLW
jgi:hypothetical protein